LLRAAIFSGNLFFIETKGKGFHMFHYNLNSVLEAAQIAGHTKTVDHYAIKAALRARKWQAGSSRISASLSLKIKKGN
jgi:hypothetical protein